MSRIRRTVPMPMYMLASFLNHVRSRGTALLTGCTLPAKESFETESGPIRRE